MTQGRAGDGPFARTWVKSSRCGPGANCVEVRQHHSGVLIRDSKDPAGPRITVGADAWRRFLDGVQAGDSHVPAGHHEVGRRFDPVRLPTS
ncbi:DUF397 domain-containing protein [Plantactinospora sp. GCM10030261]|uniref:DUF397 domain-containing protein n=1 Tax=Plantactinospora sp. GCM10030261 TaxID=3273420 RepID=UPI003615759A